MIHSENKQAWHCLEMLKTPWVSDSLPDIKIDNERKMKRLTAFCLHMIRGADLWTSLPGDHPVGLFCLPSRLE